MPITFVHGDVLCANAECIVNTVNSIGIMGKGVALRFKEKYPKECEAFNIYSKRFAVKGAPTLMKPKFIKLDTLADPKYIMFFPTKIDWRNDSKLEYIERNLPYAFERLKSLKIASVAFPWPGCGNGNLRKEDVSKIFDKYIHMYDGQVTLYEL
jgi:O-acetyl-ADP-ribose deacetylase (regulator of RNase III)